MGRGVAGGLEQGGWGLGRVSRGLGPGGDGGGLEGVGGWSLVRLLVRTDGNSPSIL